MSSQYREDIEFVYRKRQAWGVFHKHKQFILNSNISIKKRLRFFDSCVTPTMLFSLSVLPISKSKLKELDQLQRKMIRRIIGWRRISDENWKSTMSRMKIRMENARIQYDYEDWSVKYAKNIWNYAIHLSKMNNSHWGRLLTLDCQTQKFDPFSPYIPYRPPGRPRLRWDDHLRAFFDRIFPHSDLHWMYLLESACSFGFETYFIRFVIK